MKQKWNPSARHVPASTVWQTSVELAVIDATPGRLMSPDTIVDLQLVNRQAYHNMVRGPATPEALGIVINALNMAMLLCEAGIGEEWVDVVIKAQEGAFRAKVRGETTDRWGFDGPAIAVIDQALDVHEAQVEVATRDELMQAIQEMHRRIDDGHVFETAPAES